MINIILSGGSGSRLWPLSRVKLPKQFVRLFDNQSLFQKTLLRSARQCSSTLVVTNAEQYFLVLDQLQTLPDNGARASTTQFLLEAGGINTTPAIALACLTLDADELVFVTTSDRLVKEQAAYDAAVVEAKFLAEQGYLVTFGIQPTYAETGFGYIEAQGSDVLSFKEKPDAETAQAYLEQGNYYWNSGVFLQELKAHSPAIYQGSVKALEQIDSQDSVLKIDSAKMQAIPEDFIDYAVMEKYKKVKVVACDMSWSDLGSYDSLYDEVKTPEVNNTVLLRGTDALKPICLDSDNNLIVARDRQIALVDIKDLLIVDTTDALLISKKIVHKSYADSRAI